MINDWNAKPQTNQFNQQSISHTRKYFMKEWHEYMRHRHSFHLDSIQALTDSDLMSVSHVVNSDPKQILTLANSDLNPIRTLANSDPISELIRTSILRGPN